MASAEFIISLPSNNAYDWPSWTGRKKTVVSCEKWVKKPSFLFLVSESTSYHFFLTCLTIGQMAVRFRTLYPTVPLLVPSRNIDFDAFKRWSHLCGEPDTLKALI